jgi:hypothetical protein
MDRFSSMKKSPQDGFEGMMPSWAWPVMAKADVVPDVAELFDGAFSMPGGPVTNFIHVCGSNALVLANEINRHGATSR